MFMLALHAVFLQLWPLVSAPLSVSLYENFLSILALERRDHMVPARKAEQRPKSEAKAAVIGCELHRGAG